MIKFKKSKIIFTLAVVGIFMLSAMAVYALDTWNTGYRVNTETKNVLVGTGEECHKVTNISSNSYFIPTKTTAEWNAFASHLPGGVTIGSCCTPGLCKLCPGPTMPADDAACGTIDCDEKNYYYTSGSASVAGTNYCKYRNYVDITSSRCEGIENCKDANTSDCTNYGDSTVATCGICKYASGACNSCSNYANGTNCGTNKECDGSGNCVASIGTWLYLGIDCTPNDTLCGSVVGQPCSPLGSYCSHPFSGYPTFHCGMFNTHYHILFCQ